MEKGTRLKRLLGIIFAAFVMLFAHFLYVVLSVRGTEESLLYGGIPSHFIVNIVSALAAVASLALFPVREEAEEESLDELETFWDSDLSYGDSFVDTADAREAYPELFTNRTENVSEAADTSSYLEALSMAMESQKTERIDEDSIETEENGESEWAEELEGYLRIDNEGPVVTDSLSHIPLELPEGYVPFEADAEADFAEEYDLEEWEEKKEESRFKTVIIRVAAAIAVTALPIVLAFVLSATKTLYFSSGVKVCTVFSEREYKWEDCISYEIGPSFFGDRLSFKLFMSDGSEIELLPSDIKANEALFEKYDSEYEYALAVSASLDRAGAKKEVSELKTLRGGLALREDIGPYVKRLCDIE